MNKYYLGDLVSDNQRYVYFIVGDCNTIYSTYCLFLYKSYRIMLLTYPLIKERI